MQEGVSIYYMKKIIFFALDYCLFVHCYQKFKNLNEQF